MITQDHIQKIQDQGSISKQAEMQIEQNLNFTRGYSMDVEQNKCNACGKKGCFKSEESYIYRQKSDVWNIVDLIGINKENLGRNRKAKGTCIQKESDPEMMNMIYATRDNIRPEPQASTDASKIDFDHILTQDQAISYLTLYCCRTIRVVDKASVIASSSVDGGGWWIIYWPQQWWQWI